MNIRATPSFRPGNIAAIQQNITTRLSAAVQKGTKAVLDTALELVPVDTGELQSSGHMEVVIEGQTVRGSVIFDADHAAYVEFGTGIRGAASAGRGEGIEYSPTWPGMPAQSYLRASLDENRQKIKDIYREEGLGS